MKKTKKTKKATKTQKESGWYHNVYDSIEVEVRYFAYRPGYQECDWSGPWTTFEKAKKAAMDHLHYEICKAQYSMRLLVAQKEPAKS